MKLFVNGEQVEESLILDEIERLKPDYQRVFRDQPPEEQEAQLRIWCRENVIEGVLLRQEALKDARPVPGEEIEKHIHSLIEEYGSEGALYRQLGIAAGEKEKLEKEVEKRLRVDRFIDSLCEDIRKPSESAMKKYYQGHRQDYMGQERVRASHIVVHVSENCSEFDAYQKIVRAKKALQEGTSFEEAAAQFSDCPDRGGDLGYFGRGQMVEEFDDVVFKMKKGEVSQVFQTSFGFHIARVMNRTPAKPLPFKSVMKTIEDKLVAERRTKRIESFLDELKEKAEIVEE